MWDLPSTYIRLLSVTTAPKNLNCVAVLKFVESMFWKIIYVTYGLILQVALCIEEPPNIIFIIADDLVSDLHNTGLGSERAEAY